MPRMEEIIVIRFYDRYSEGAEKKHLFKGLAIAFAELDISWHKFEEILEINAIIQYENEYYALLQDAYIDGPIDNPYYTASAICLSGDKIGELCTIYWSIKLDEYNQSLASEDSEMCDWDNPSNVKF